MSAPIFWRGSASDFVTDLVGALTAGELQQLRAELVRRTERGNPMHLLAAPGSFDEPEECEDDACTGCASCDQRETERRVQFVRVLPGSGTRQLLTLGVVGDNRHVLRVEVGGDVESYRSIDDGPAEITPDEGVWHPVTDATEELQAQIEHAFRAAAMLC